VSGSISPSGSFIMTVDTAHATDASTAIHTPKGQMLGARVVVAANADDQRDASPA
jgi:hypothetical protein